jgi:DNA-binding beta-propeller fold protein YncE
MKLRIVSSKSNLALAAVPARPSPTSWVCRIGLAFALLAVMVAADVSAEASAPEADQGEVWVTSQGTDRIFILGGRQGQGGIETVELPAGTGPHIITFSPAGEFAYVSGMGNGDLSIVRADDRQLVATLDVANAGTHQAKPSPDGSVLLVAQIATQSLIKVAADAPEAWTVAGKLFFGEHGTTPICTVFRDDGQRAYVSLLPSGIAIVDVPTMEVLDTLPTDGFVACGMVAAKDGRSIVVASSGGGGHISRLDTTTDALIDAGTLGAADWHSLNVSANGDVGFGSSPGSDELILVDLGEPSASLIATLSLDPTPGTGNDQPDAIAVRGDAVYVTLRASGKLAIVTANRRTVTYVDLSRPAPFNPVNCAGCALHGVTVRP